MSKKYDDFDEADQDGFFDQVFGIISNRRREFAILSVAAAVVVLGLIVWDGYSGGAQEGESVPIVRADAGDYKTTPDEPGGMEIPYRDSTVFSSAETEGVTENILDDQAAAEAPVSKEEMFAGLKTDDAAVDAVAEEPVAADAQTVADAGAGEVEDTVAAMTKVEAVEAPSDDTLVKDAIGIPAEKSQTAAKVEPVTPVQETAKVEEKAVEKPAEKTAEKATAKEVAKAEPAAGSTAAKAVTPGNYYIQLASVKDSSGAASEYKKMQAKYTGLSGVDFRSQKADLGAKGTFYRIQAGPMSKDSATSVCGSIKSSGGSCLVVAK